MEFTENTDNSSRHEDTSKTKKTRGDIRKESLYHGDWQIRVSLQICSDPGLALERIKGILNEAVRSRQKHQRDQQGGKIDTLTALIELLTILMLPRSEVEHNYIGYMMFQEAFERYAGHNMQPVNKDTFLLHLLDEQHGLPVNILRCKGDSYIILKSSSFDYVSFFKLMNIVSAHKSDVPRICIDKTFVQDALKEFDTKWDKSLAEILVAGNKSHSEIRKLGINDDNIQVEYERVQCIIDELKNTRVAASDMVELQLKAKISSLENNIQQLQNKQEKVKDVWDKSEIDKTDRVIAAKMERVTSVRDKLEQKTPNGVKRFQSSVKHKAIHLAEENRLKRRKLGSGRKRKLDSEAEDFIVRCIEEKGEAHGRRHDSVVYGGKRVKYDDLFDMTNRHLARRNKPLITSKSTVRLLSKPKYIRSRQAKLHHGRALFCTRKPPKDDKEDNENTHHQRCQIKLLKHEMFGVDDDFASQAVMISMDDKSYMRPDTDIGVKGARKQAILTPADNERSRSLPQHDFSNPKSHITPSSFRFMTKKLDEVTNELTRDEDQSVVVIRPKYYVGSTGSVWGSDYMKICHEYPHLYEVGEKSDWGRPVKQFCTAVSDYTNYFLDTSEKEDIVRVEKSENGKHKEYERKRIDSLVHGLDTAMNKYQILNDLQQDLIEPLTEKVESCLNYAKSIQTKINASSGKMLYNMYMPLFDLCTDMLMACESLHAFDMKSIVAENTDAGPGVGVSNFEVGFRMAEISRIHKTERRTRVHRSRGDSSHNESERTNACIGEALVDGGAIKWEYFKPLDGITEEDIEAMGIDEIAKEEDECMERNAWKVADEVVERVHMEPGPAGDLMLGMLTEKPPNHFFYNTAELQIYHKSGKEKRKCLPGYNYFKKIEKFMDEHIERGELYLEYLMGGCTKDNDYPLCNYCETRCPPCKLRKKSPKPYPDYSKIPNLKYLPLESTPTEDRTIDDYLPRANLKKMFIAQTISSTDERSIRAFVEKFVVEEEFVVKYLKHLELLDLKKRKRAEKRKAQKTIDQKSPKPQESSDSETSESSDDSDMKAVRVVMTILLQR